MLQTPRLARVCGNLGSHQVHKLRGHKWGKRRRKLLNLTDYLLSDVKTQLIARGGNIGSGPQKRISVKCTHDAMLLIARLLAGWGSGDRNAYKTPF